MNDAFLVNSSTEGLTPLGTAPQRSFELVSGTVADRLGPAHAALFAEPVSSEHGDRYDWYATVSGTPKRLVDLADAEQARARAERDRLAADIRALAARLSASDQGDDQRLGEALANALEVPGEEAVWVVTGLPDDRLQPVLVNWAWIRDHKEPVRGALSGPGPRPQPAPPPIPPVAEPAAVPAAPAVAVERLPGATPWATAEAPPRDAGAAVRWLIWLGWLILAAMIAAILYLATEACALRLPGFPANCPIAEDTALARERLLLEDRVLEAERRIQAADRACQPEPVELTELPPLPPDLAPEPTPDPAPEPPPPPPPSEADERIRASGAQTGELTFTLIWDSPDDLDLHVTCPAGQTIFYIAKQACGGALDIDSNAGSIVAQPIENVFFTNPAEGAYRIRVDYFTSRTGGAPRSFQLQIRDSAGVQTLTGTVDPARPVWETTYQAGGQ